MFKNIGFWNNLPLLSTFYHFPLQLFPVNIITPISLSPYLINFNSVPIIPHPISNVNTIFIISPNIFAPIFAIYKNILYKRGAKIFPIII